MDADIQRIKEVADSLTGSENGDSITKAAELLKFVAEIENQRAQTRRLENEVEDSAKHTKLKETKEFIALTAPLVTTLVLAGTLALQGIQFTRSERDKDADAQRQRDAASQQAKQQRDTEEDAIWADALKQLASSEKWSPSAMLLRRFGNSPRYASEAQLTAVRLMLLKTANASDFNGLFESVFVPVKWESLSQVIAIDTQLHQQVEPLLVKAWDEKTHTTRWDRTKPTEKKQFDNLNAELGYISGQLAILLKGKRPPSQSLNFRSMVLWDTDLKGADLSGADFTGSNLSNLNLEGANLSGADLRSSSMVFLNLEGANLSAITSFASVSFVDSAWWESSAISPQLCAHLKETFPVSLEATYASGRKFTNAQYEAAVTTLCAGK